MRFRNVIIAVVVSTWFQSGITRPVSAEEPTHRVTVRVLDGEEIPARVSIVGSDGKPYAPPGSILRNPEQSAAYFYTNGKFDVELPPGTAQLELHRGLEYVPATFTVDVGAPTDLRVNISRWSHMAAEGWYSGDSHVHLHTGGKLKVDMNDARQAIVAEDLNYANMCISNVDGDDIRDQELITGKPHELSDPSHLIVFGEEMRSSIYGHMQFFGINKLVEPQYTGFDDTPNYHDYPPNFDMAEKAIQQGAVVTYGHPIINGHADAFSTNPLEHNACARELPIDAMLGTIHAMDLMCYNSEEDLSTELWYRLLNTGLKISACAGTDALLDRETDPLGGSRVYVKVDGKLTMRNWLAGLKAGRTFVTNGPMVALNVNGKEIGGTISLDSPGTVRVNARVQSYLPVDKLEILVNGKVEFTLPCPKKADPHTIVVQSLSMDLAIDKSSWVAVKASGGEHRHVFDGPVFAHTGPVYVSVGDHPISNPDDAAYFVDWIDKVLTVMDRRNRYAQPEDRQRVEKLFRTAQTRYQEKADGGN